MEISAFNIKNLLNSYQEQYKFKHLGESYIKDHGERYMQSLIWIYPFINPNSKILEIGGKGPFTYLIRKYFPKVRIDNTNWDLSYAWPKQVQKYDIILNMEIIEHVKDQVHSLKEVVNFSGINCFLSECRKALKKNGVMFLTTPNICSYASIYRLLIETTPYMYQPHFREFSKPELLYLLHKNKFSIKKFQTVNVWLQPTGTLINLIKSIERVKILTKPGYRKERGDDFFVLATNDT